MMTFNVLEYCRQRRLPLVFSSTREVYGDVHRFEGYGEDDGRLRLHGEPVLRLEDRERGVHLRLRALLRAQVPRLPLLERLRALRQRPAPDVARAAALHPLDVARRADHGLRRRRQGARLHLHRRLRRRDLARDRGARRRPRHERDDQPGVRRGQHARPRRRADRGRARRRAEDDDRAVAARRGDALRGRHPQGARPARRGTPQVPLDEGIPPRGRLVPASTAPPTRTRTGRS